MTFRKSGLLSLVLGLTVIGATACGDTVTIPPTPDPITTISITPSAPIALQVGQQATVSAVIAGGGATTVRTVTYASSVPAVATVNPQTGVVTAVAPGTTTIVATSTADVNLRASVQVTVTAAPTTQPPTPTTISIARILQGGTNIPVNINNVAGQIDVVLNVDAPTQTTVQRVEVLIDGVVACTQTFTAGAQQDGLASAQVPVEIVCSVNTAAVNAQGVALYQSGMRTVSARAIGPTGNTLATAVSRQLNFANVNVVNVRATEFTTTAAAGTQASAADAAGLIWRQGDVVVTARPAIFTGGAVERITICVTPQDGPNAGVSACRTATSLTDNAFTATFPKATAITAATSPGVGGVTTTDLRVTVNTIVAGEQGPGLTVATGPTMRLDNVAPAAPTVALQNVNNNWVGSAYMLNATNVVTAAAVDVAPGVGGVTYTFHTIAASAYAGLGTTDAARNAAVVAQGQQVTQGSQLNPTDTNQDLIMVVRAADALGNQVLTRLPGTFGVDLQAPEFTIVAGAPANQMINPVTPFTFTFTDDRSGFAVDPVQVRMIRYTGAATTRCIDVNTAVDSPVPTAGCGFVQLTGTSMFSVPNVDGYYEITVRVRDRAGNVSSETTRTVLVDNTAPTVTITRYEVAGINVTVDGTIADNIDLRQNDVRLWFGAVSLPLTVPAQIGTFGPNGRIVSQTRSATVTLWRGLQMVDAGGAPAAITNVSGAGFGAWDMAYNFGRNQVPASTAASNGAPADLQTFVTTSSGNTACSGVAVPSGDAVGTACPTAAPVPPATRTITATATGPTGTFANPFTVVHFYYTDWNGNAILFASTGAATTLEQTAPTVNRLYRWTATFNAAGLPAGYMTQVFAVGVDADRDALMSNAAGITLFGARNIP
jgi:hypothetical protein